MQRQAAAAQTLVAGIVTLVAVLLLWEVVARLIANDLFLPPLTAVVARIAKLSEGGQLLRHVGASVGAFALGFVPAVIIGIAIGIVVGLSAPRGVALGVAGALGALPLFMLAPLTLLWLGVGLGSKVVSVLAAAVCPIMGGVMAHLAGGERQGTGPAPAPGTVQPGGGDDQHISAAVFAGLRTGVIFAVVGLVLAEILGANAGLGYLMLNGIQLFDTALSCAGFVMIALPTMVLVIVLQAIETLLGGAKP